MNLSRLWTRFCAMPHVVHILLAIALICIAVPVFAEEYMVRIGGDSVRITDGPCPQAILATVEQGQRGYLRAALSVVAGREYPACWALFGSTVLLWYADGDRGAIPAAQFKPAPEA